jgi:hypothetical protein
MKGEQQRLDRGRAPGSTQFNVLRLLLSSYTRARGHWKRLRHCDAGPPGVSSFSYVAGVDYRYELRRGDEVVATDHLSHERPLGRGGQGGVDPLDQGESCPPSRQLRERQVVAASAGA